MGFKTGCTANQRMRLTAATDATIVRRPECVTLFTLWIGLIAALGAWCTLRLRREYVRQNLLSSMIVVAVWVFYVSHFVITLTAAASSRWLVPVNQAITLVSGIVLACVGITFFIGGLVSLGSFRRISGMDTSTLVTTGAYRWSRNPQNVGWELVLVGIALVGRSGLALLMAAVFWVTFRTYVGAEEEFLERIFGDEYRDYKAWSHRYLGRPRNAGIGE